MPAAWRPTAACSSPAAALKVGGTAQLGGTLAVALLSGFAPAPGDQFPILTCSNRVGTFSAVQMPAGLALNYSSTNVMLVVTGTVPAQITGPAVASGNFVFSFGTLSNQSYTVQFNDDLADSNWLFYTDLTGNGSLMRVVAPLTSAPRRFFRMVTH
ncbi:MAG: hypothetical protein NT154_26230 [Verrucomicrobia bacterium]|nr:hypothetical protein [Verrucomicrobiota bacterium]